MLWFANNVMVEEQIMQGNRTQILEGGRYLFIQRLTAAQRMMRYHCVVNNFRDENGMPMRAPTTYTLTANLANAGVNLFKDLGSMDGAVGDRLEFVFAAAAATQMNTALPLAVSCIPNDLVTLTNVESSIVIAILKEAARNVERVNFTCTTGSFDPPISRTLLGSITVVSSKFLLC